MLGQQRELARSDDLGEGQGPGRNVVAAAGSRAGDRDLRCHLENSRAKRIPAVEKVLQGPIAGEIVPWNAVFVRLIADLDTKQVFAQSRDGKSDFFCCQCRGRGSEVDRVKTKPAGRLEEAGEIRDVGRRNLLVRAVGIRGPQKPIDETSPKTQHAAPEVAKSRMGL